MSCFAGLSGAELANLVNEAAIAAARSDAATINSAIFDEARDKILMGAARRSMVQTEAARKLTAYHESGHALVAINTPGSNPIHKVGGSAKRFACFAIFCSLRLGNGCKEGVIM